MKKKAKNNPTSLKLRRARKIKKKISKKTKKVVAQKGKIIPLGDRILLKPILEEELNKTASGIIIPETVSKEKPEQGVVIAVGEGRWDDGKRVPISVKVGDRVVFSRYGYDEVKLDGKEYYILKEENILAILN